MDDDWGYLYDLGTPPYGDFSEVMWPVKKIMKKSLDIDHFCAETPRFTSDYSLPQSCQKQQSEELMFTTNLKVIMLLQYRP